MHESKGQPHPPMDDHRRALGETLFAGVAFTVVLFVAVYGLWMEAQRTALEQVRSDLPRLAATMATLVDPVQHERIRAAGLTDTPDYQRAIAPLRRAHKAAVGVKYVYTIMRQDDTLRIILDTAEPGDHDGDGKEDRALVGQAYADADSEMLVALGTPGHPGHALASRSPSSDEWGTFISGYAPLLDAQHQQIGILGIDVDAADYVAAIAARRRALILGVIPAAVLVLALSLGIYRVRRRQLAAHRQVMRQQQQVLDAETSVARQERRFRSVIEGAGVLALEYDRSLGRITSVSPHGLSLGYGMDDWATPRFLRGILHEADQEPLARFMGEARTPGARDRIEFRLRSAGGRDTWVQLVISIDQDESRPSVISGVLLDVSEARQLREAAVAASQAKSAFVANMSHEIRTPLTAILGYAELLREDGDARSAPVARLQTIDTIRTAGQHLLAIINDILDLSKIEAGRMTVETVAIDLPRLFIECESLLAPRAAAKGLAFSIGLDTPIPDRALADPTRLRQIILNLAGNAIKFTTAGHVSIRASVVNPDEMVQTLRIDVDDSGPGLTPEQSSSLFAAFAQGDASVTRLHGGTGLGLIISRRLAELMGGDVRLHRSGLGQGCTFRIDVEIVPQADAAAVTSLRAASARASLAGGAEAPQRLAGRVLVAEDNPVNQRLLEVFLAKAGASVRVASDGAQALALLDASEGDGTPYDLLITDMQMPVMDGYTLARTLRARGSTLPIIALTAHALSEDRQRCLDAGCDEYARKPIDLPGLLGLCARWIDAAPREGESATLTLVGDSPALPAASRTTDDDPLRQTA